MPIRKYPKNRLKGGAEIMLPHEQAPSLKNPSRRAFIDSAHNVSGIEIKTPRCICIGGDFLLIRKQQGIRKMIGIVPITHIFNGLIFISLVDLPLGSGGNFDVFYLGQTE